VPRSSRMTWLNYPHLVIAEANGESALFRDEADYHAYLAELRQLARDHVLRVFAFCLMDKELRLLIQPSRLMLSRIMQRLHGKHSARMNQKYDRHGHLFRGRFRSLLLPKESVLSVVRSIHLWPVRSGVVRRPEHYRFSSHGAYMGQDPQSSDFLKISDVLESFKGDNEAKRRAFTRYLEESLTEPDDYGAKEVYPGIGGSVGLAEDMQKKLQELAEKRPRRSSVRLLAERTGLLLGINLDYIVGSSKRQDLVMARRLIATAAVIGASRTVTEVAAFLARDKAQVSRLVSQGLDLLENDEPFLSLFEALKSKGGSFTRN
jgi:putative transposase